MRNRTRKHVIYINKKRKVSRNKSKEYITVPLGFLAIIFGGLFLLSIFSTYFLLTSHKKETSVFPQSVATIGVLSKLMKRTTTLSPTQFPFHITLLSTNVLTPTPTAKINVPVHIIPVAQAQANTANDYCLNVPVLLYHHIEPIAQAQKEGHAQLTVDSNYFDQQMAYLAKNGYHAISSDELADALIRHQALPAKSIVVTIDDGYEDNYTYAFQILKKYNITGNFAIPSGLIENKGYMTWSQLKEIASNSNMHIYNHTWSHAALGGASKDKIEYEIITANKQFESNLGKHINIFYYPYGSFSPLAIDVLKEQGFIAAFSTIGGRMQCESYIYVLRRERIGNEPLSSYGF
jgi:peptidoglycan/xylan/chitin deacetylase (PgdA/CDA1 family)